MSHRSWAIRCSRTWRASIPSKHFNRVATWCFTVSSESMKSFFRTLLWAYTRSLSDVRCLRETSPIRTATGMPRRQTAPHTRRSLGSANGVFIDVGFILDPTGHPKTCNFSLFFHLGVALWPSWCPKCSRTAPEVDFPRIRSHLGSMLEDFSKMFGHILIQLPG